MSRFFKRGQVGECRVIGNFVRQYAAIPSAWAPSLPAGLRAPTKGEEAGFATLLLVILVTGAKRRVGVNFFDRVI